MSGLKIVQSEKGYRYSIDPFILSAFVTIKPGNRIIDLGTGNGIIPLLLCQRERDLKIVGIEIQEHLVRLAQENVRLNGLDDSIEIILLDIKRVEEAFPPGSFDLALGNPPYWPLRNGRINPDREKAIARHELAITLAEYLASAAYLVRERGLVSLIILPYRLGEIFYLMKEHRLSVSRIRCVHSYLNSPAKLVLVEGIKAASTQTRIEKPLIIYGQPGSYSAEMQSIYQGYGIIDREGDI